MIVPFKSPFSAGISNDFQLLAHIIFHLSSFPCIVPDFVPFIGRFPILFPLYIYVCMYVIYEHICIIVIRDSPSIFPHQLQISMDFPIYYMISPRFSHLSIASKIASQAAPAGTAPNGRLRGVWRRWCRGNPGKPGNFWFRVGGLVSGEWLSHRKMVVLMGKP